VTYQWFMPDLPGESVVTCREYCGAGHSNMYGTVVAMPQSDWDSWMASEVAAISPAGDKAIDVAVTTDQSSEESISGGKS